MGSRVENTHAKGIQLFNGASFDRNYTQLFPTLFLGYKPNDKNQFSLNYGRRIQRPDYEDLNPFYYFLDKYTYQVGNPYLQPQISQNIELNHIYKGFLTTGLSYGVINNLITNMALPITKFWKINWYNQLNINQYNGFVNQGPIHVSGINYSTNFTSSFEMKKGLNFAISKQVLKNKGTIRLNCRDFLNLQHFSGYSRFQNVDVQLNNKWDNRVFNISFTYRFAKGKAGAAPRKSAGAIDEASRVKSNN